jgi:hypothetical protein
VLRQAEQVGPAQHDRSAARLAVASEREPPAVSGLGLADPGAGRGLVDLEIVGGAHVLAVRREQRGPPQRTAHRLADGQQPDEGRARAGERDTPRRGSGR